MTPAAQLLAAVVPIVRTRLPRGVDVDYLDDFVERNRAVLEAVIAQNLGPLLGRLAANRPMDEDIPELWSAAKRTAANIAAMATAAKLYAQKRTPNADERAVLAGYSGWGGLSIQAAAGRFPPGFPAPEERGLIHQRVRSRNFLNPAEPAVAHPSSCAARARLRRHPRRAWRRRPPPARPRRARVSPPSASRRPR
jgi:hypothetical protein